MQASKARALPCRHFQVRHTLLLTVAATTQVGAEHGYLRSGTDCSPVVQLLQFWVHAVSHTRLSQKSTHRHVVRRRKLKRGTHHAGRQLPSRYQLPAPPICSQACSERGRAMWPEWSGGALAQSFPNKTNKKISYHSHPELAAALLAEAQGELACSPACIPTPPTLQKAAEALGADHQPLPSQPHSFHCPDGGGPSLAGG